MMKKRRKNNNCIFGETYSPYISPERETMDEWYEEYVKDDAKDILIDGVTYVKIIVRNEFSLHRKYSFIVWIPSKGRINLNDILMDEDGREFRVTGFPHFRFVTIPVWYPEIIPIEIKGETDQIGEYLAIKETRHV